MILLQILRDFQQNLMKVSFQYNLLNHRNRQVLLFRSSVHLLSNQSSLPQKLVLGVRQIRLFHPVQNVNQIQTNAHDFVDDFGYNLPPLAIRLIVKRASRTFQQKLGSVE